MFLLAFELVIDTGATAMMAVRLAMMVAVDIERRPQGAIASAHVTRCLVIHVPMPIGHMPVLSLEIMVPAMPVNRMARMPVSNFVHVFCAMAMRATTFMRRDTAAMALWPVAAFRIVLHFCHFDFPFL